MKKIIVAIALGAFLLSYHDMKAQTSVNIGVNVGNTIPGPDDGFYYGGEYDYPDSYYSEYPSDYYPNDYYQDNYNDYQSSIADVNWNNLFLELHLSTAQVHAILVLNNRFPSFGVWDSFYRVNPTRWYYDRFYTLRRILTPAQFIFFQNRYYRGQSPVVYFSNYHRSHYVPRFRVTPRYRNVNIATYRRSPWSNRVHYGRVNQNGHRYNGYSNRGFQNSPNRSGRNRQNFGTRNPQEWNRGNNKFNNNQGAFTHNDRQQGQFNQRPNKDQNFGSKDQRQWQRKEFGNGRQKQNRDRFTGNNGNHGQRSANQRQDKNRGWGHRS